MIIKPTIQLCDGRGGRYNHCDQPRYIVCKSRMQCNTCSEAYKRELKKQKGKPVGGIKTPNKRKVEKELERLDRIKKNNEYYLQSIATNVKRNGGVCRCDECNYHIKWPNGKNVSHVIGQGANGTLYHHPLNHFIFGNMLKGECDFWQSLKL